jgi:hypothetical protein
MVKWGWFHFSRELIRLYRTGTGGKYFALARIKSCHVGHLAVGSASHLVTRNLRAAPSGLFPCDDLLTQKPGLIYVMRNV